MKLFQKSISPPAHPLSHFFQRGLFTVQQNTRLAGELLVESLLKLINGETVESMLLPTQLIVRDSCGEKLAKS